MGGHAFPGTVRLNPAQHRAWVDRCLTLWSDQWPGVRAASPAVVAEKSSHGDVDLLIDATAWRAVVGEDVDVAIARAAAVLGATSTRLEAATRTSPDDGVRRWTTEQGVVCLAVPSSEGLVQVDLMLHPGDTWATACVYYGHHDLGFLIGQQAARRGYAWTPSGLYADPVTPTGSRLLATSEASSALAFLGYDPLRLAKGLRTWDEVFSFVASCPGFDPSPYDPARQTSALRRKARNRPLQHAFVAWLNDQPAVEVSPSDRVEWKAKGDDRFPHLVQARAQAEHAALQAEAIAQAISREGFAQATGRTGEDLLTFRRSVLDAHGGREGARAWVGREGLDAWKRHVQEASQATQPGVSRGPSFG